MPRALRGSHKWRSIARRPTTVDVWQDEKPHGSSVEMKAESAARKAFYTYASTEVNRAYITEDGDKVASYIPLLPRNTDEVRATELYTDAVWPTSANDGKTYLHYGTSCPNYKKGAPCGLASVAAYDGQDKCNRCHFGVSSLGAVAAPSTSIENGFEYHFDQVQRGSGRLRRLPQQGARARASDRG